MFLIKSLKLNQLQQQQHKHLIFRYLRNNRYKILGNPTATEAETPTNQIFNGFPVAATEKMVDDFDFGKSTMEFQAPSIGLGGKKGARRVGMGEFGLETNEKWAGKPKDKNQHQLNEIENLEMIEMNLFENSTQKTPPSSKINTKKILNKWKKTTHSPSPNKTNLKNFMKKGNEEEIYKRSGNTGSGGGSFNFNELNRQSFVNQQQPQQQQKFNASTNRMAIEQRQERPKKETARGSQTRENFNFLNDPTNNKNENRKFIYENASDEAATEMEVVAQQNAGNIKLPYDLKYRTIPAANKYLENLMHVMKSRKYRHRKRQILIEGKRLILDAIESNLRLKTLIFSQLDDFNLIRLRAMEKLHGNWDLIDNGMDDGGAEENIEWLKLPYDSINNWSNLTTSPGLIGIFHMDNFTENRPLIKMAGGTIPKTLPITVVCDQIREPQNLGSIIRTAAAIPCTQLILLKGCTDPWDSKVIRAAAGGHFHNLKIIQHHAGPGNADYRKEGECEKSNSLNWKNLHNYLSSNVTGKEFRLIIAENNRENVLRKCGSASSSSSNDVRDADELAANPLMDKLMKLPKIQEYTNFSFGVNADSDAHFDSKFHYVVIIGGETNGISSDAYQFIQRHNGICLNIPLADGIDSLNSATALAILLFELKRNFLGLLNK